MEVRVRLVFADDVGRHVQRQRGFSSCWYLVPKDAKLVGDLAYVLQREFGLRKTCPQGLELRLEELPVLATQSIRIVRDNDTIVVQCPLAEDVPASSDPSSESEEENNMKRRKRKSRGKKNEDTERVHKRLTRYQDVLKKVQERMSAEKKARRRQIERGCFCLKWSCK
uniref:Coilin N-terminal domain-containing protein n=1 Tax=Phytophthora ramorum TaxID=164328 RepID=H3GQ70_PHYRM